MTITTGPTGRTSTLDQALTRTPASAVRGRVAVFGGRGETPEVYERLATRLAVDGYEVVAVASTPAPELLDAVRSWLDERTAGPAVVVASDAAVALAVRAVVRHDLRVDGLVLAGLLTSASVAAGGDEVEARTACPVHGARLRDGDVLESGRLVRPAPGEELTAEDVAAVPVPVLALHGTADQISPVDAALAVLADLPRALPAGVWVVEGGRHDVLNDLTHRTVAASVVQFLERLRAPGTGIRAV